MGGCNRGGGASIAKDMRRVPVAGVIAVGAAALIALAAPTWAQSRGIGGGRPASSSRMQGVPPRNVPGLGFDYTHLAAISQPTGTSRASRHSGGPLITPILSWGLPSYSAPQPIVIVLPPPTVIVVPVPAPAMMPSAEAATPPVSADTAPTPPLRELGQFILVRRDGQIILTGAFSASRDLLTYITSEGIRRAFPLDQLDIETTQQMNEAAGTTLTLPN